MDELTALRYNERIYRNMLSAIFEPYERMWFSQEDLDQKDKDILLAVAEAHKRIGSLIKVDEYSENGIK